MLDVSVVVCTKNARAIIGNCLASIRDNQPREVIVVDGCSTDGTQWVAESWSEALTGFKLLTDNGLGLAHARNVGLDAAKGKYIAYVGPDNLLMPDTLESMIWRLEYEMWSGVSVGTELTGEDWLTRSMNAYKRQRYTPGRRSIIGTPHLWRRNVLGMYRFDDTLTSSDDADLCQRMGERGHAFGIAWVKVKEIGTTTWPDIKRRWLWYGNSDHEFWRKYSQGWTWRRKVKSLLHPLTAEFIEPVRKDWRLAVFCLLITGLRYWGWLRSARHDKAI